MARPRSRSARLSFVAFALAVAILAAAAGGCADGEGDPQDPEPARPARPLETWVGKVSGSDAYIALISDGERLAGYLTDGGVLSTWFSVASIEDDEASLASREGAELGEVSFDEDEVATGEVKVGPDSFPFEARPAAGEAGLYQAADRRGEDSFQAGWIVLPDGSNRGSLDTFIDDEFESRPAPRLATSVAVPGFGSFVPEPLTSAYLDNTPEAP